MNSQAQRFTLAAVGDVVLARDDPKDVFSLAIPDLLSADFRTCNLEVPLSERGMPEYGKPVTLHSSPGMIEGFVHAGFDLVSLANNHTMDYGPMALTDTIDLLRSNGITHAGAGVDLREAWEPAYHDINGLRVAFLSYASVAHPGYGATTHRPGIAMIRCDPSFENGGLYPDDVSFMQNQIALAATDAQAVVVFFHWGISQSRATSTSQRVLARTAIEAGACAVIGHHPHVLQGVEVYQEAPILYSLGNFVFDLQPYFFDVATSLTAIARLDVTGAGVDQLRLLPMIIDPDGRPRRTERGSAEETRILRDLQALSAEFGTPLETESGTLVIDTLGTTSPG